MIAQEDLKLSSFHDWLYNQPNDREFDFTDAGACLIASWLREAGLIAEPSVTTDTIRETGGHEVIYFPPWLQRVSNHAIGLPKHIFSVREFLDEYVPYAA